MFEHKYIKLLDYVVRQKKTSFHLQPGFDESGLSKDEFLLIQDSFFYRDNLPDNYETASQELEWRLKPEALFGYLSYKQYEHAIHSAKWALWIATASLAAGMIGALRVIFM
jgi:hypothetical protein